MRLLRILFMISVLRYQTGTQLSVTLTERAREYCPYNNVCTTTSTANYTAPNNTICCFQCYCDGHCWNFHDCCPDVQSERSPEHRDVQYHSVAFVGSNLRTDRRKDINDGILSKRHMMQTECPDNYNGADAEKCRVSYNSTLGLDDILLVSDSKHWHRIYRNKHCARCNGVDDVRRWILRVEFCSPGIHDIHLSWRETAQFMLMNCVLISLPFKGLESTLSTVCSPKQCNVDKNASDVARACFEEDHLSLVLSSHTLFEMVIFKNVFCYLCEQDYDDSLVSTCTRIPTYSRNTATNLVVLLDTTKPMILVDPSRFCGESEMFDIFFVKCRPLFCRRYMSVFQGKCVHIGTIPDGPTFYLFTIFVPLSKNITLAPPHIPDEYVEEVWVMLHKHFNLPKCTLLYAIVKSYAEKQNDIFAFMGFQYAVKTSAQCPIQQIITSITYSVRKKLILNIVVGNLTVDFVVKMNFYKFGDENDLYRKEVFKQLSVQMVQKGSSWNRAWLVLDMYECPYFIFNVSEYVQVVQNKNGEALEISNLTMASVLENGFYPLSLNEVGICVEHFESFLSAFTFVAYSKCLIIFCTVLNIIVSSFPQTDAY